MSRWMLSTTLTFLFGVAALAEDRPQAKPAKVIRVLVLEDGQPLPAGPSAAVAVPGIVVDDSAIGASASCQGSDGKSKKQFKKLSGVFKKEDCEGCGSLRYYSWFAWSSCRSF